MKVQLVLGSVLLDNLKTMVEQVVINSNKKQLRGDERTAIIEAYSDAIALTHMNYSDAIALTHMKKESFRQEGSFWAGINTPIKEKFGIGTLTKIKTAAWNLFEDRHRAGRYSV